MNSKVTGIKICVEHKTFGITTWQTDFTTVEDAINESKYKKRWMDGKIAWIKLYCEDSFGNFFEVPVNHYQYQHLLKKPTALERIRKQYSI